MPIVTEITLIKLPEVMKRTGLKRATIYSLMAQKKFPLSLKITNTSVAWRSDSISAWIDSLSASSIGGAE